MDQQWISRQKNKLMADRKEILEQIDSLEGGGLNFSLSESIEELSTYDNHPADVGTETFERAKDLALLDNAHIQLKKIDDALEHIDRGNYGRCDNCGREIDPDRLEAIPETTLCLHCRELSDKRNDRISRPVEEDVVVPPWGGINQYNGEAEDNLSEERIEFDGEDAWQVLAQGTEHAEESGAGSYYGWIDLDEERGNSEEVDDIAYFRGADGIIYEDVYGKDDERPPWERLVGDTGWDKVNEEEESK